MAVITEVTEEDAALIEQVTGMNKERVIKVTPQQARVGGCRVRRRTKKARAPAVASDQALSLSDSDDSDRDADAPLQDVDADTLYEELQDAQLSPATETTFDVITWIMPLTFVFEMLNLLVQKQYHQETTLARELITLVTRMPRTSTHSHPQRW